MLNYFAAFTTDNLGEQREKAGQGNREVTPASDSPGWQADRAGHYTSGVRRRNATKTGLQLYAHWRHLSDDYWAIWNIAYRIKCVFKNAKRLPWNYFEFCWYHHHCYGLNVIVDEVYHRCAAIFFPTLYLTQQAKWGSLMSAGRCCNNYKL